MIEIEKAVKIYLMGDEEVRAVNNVSLNVKQGEFVALRGASGSGKSTLMHIIGCLDKMDAGRYSLDGTDISDYEEAQLAEIRNKKIGFIHQSFNLLPRLSAVENVELPLFYSGIPRNQRRQKAEENLTKVGLKHRMKHLPHQMSGGEQQRVAIARALVNDAPLILADEPTGNLDSKVSIEVMTIISRLHERGSTVVLVTHEEETAEYAKRSVYLSDGMLAQ